MFVPAYPIPAQVLKTTTLTVRTLPEDFLYPLLSTSGTDTITSCWIVIILIVITSLTC